MVKLQRTDRRLFLSVSIGLALTPWRITVADDMPKIQVFKSAACGCCKMWVDHLVASGFDVEAEDVANLDSVKQMASVPNHLMACHTGIVEGYTIEGHIPATAIKKLLAERPAIQGLAGPGMPAGSPGMPSSAPERYDVVAFGDDEERVFMSFVETDPK